MEFPNLGEHCELAECRRLDFLPIKCSACKKIFCSEHFLFDKHHCPCNDAEQSQRRPQDPICPLCNKPVPIKAGDSPDYTVSEHIDQNCAIKRDKVYKNRCTVEGCKRKELMPLLCERCKLNHCLLHRHPNDHQCKGPSLTGPRAQSDNARAAASRSISSFARRGLDGIGNLRTNISNSLNTTVRSSVPNSRTTTEVAAASAAMARSSSTGDNLRAQDNRRQLQGDLTEEEALNIAIQESLQQPPPPPSDSARPSQTSSLLRSGSNCKLS